MNMRFIFVALSVTFLSFLAISCQKTPDNIVLALSQIEKCMESAPDSALTLLKSIPNPETLRGKAQADYALLMTQAMDKNYIIPTSDSLISLAVGYYGAHSENPMAMGKSFFYCGRVMYALKRNEDAMRYYLSAKKVFDDTQEYKILGLISEEIGHLNREQNLYENALVNYQDSRNYFTLANDELSLSYALRNMGRIYLSMIGKLDSAYMYYQQALQIAHKKHLDSEFSILQELGMGYRSKGDYIKAEYYLLQALGLNKNNRSLAEMYLSLGFTYLKMNDVFKAEKYLRLSTNSPYILTQVDAYNTLFKLEKSRGNLLLAIEYKEKSDSFKIITKNSEIREITADLQKKYENEKLQKENLQIKIGYKNVMLFSLMLFFVVVLLACYYTYKNRTAKRKIRDIEQTIVDNEEEIASCQQDIAEYRLLQSESEEHKIELVTEIAKLDGKVSILSKHNKDLTHKLQELGESTFVPILDPKMEDVYVRAFRIYLAIRMGIFNTGILSNDWERVFKLFDFLYSGFVERLKSEYPKLTKHDLEICCLLKIGLSNEELGKVFSTTSESTTKAKGRMKKRLNLSADDDLEQFISRY